MINLHHNHTQNNTYQNISNNNNDKIKSKAISQKNKSMKDIKK
jgi:hypothetical protein